MNNLRDKIENAKKIIKEATDKYPKIQVGCSFGKDSMVVVHLARDVDEKIPIFSVMTVFKPAETLNYLVEMNRKMNLGIKVYLVNNEVPDILKNNSIDTVLLKNQEFKSKWNLARNKKNRPLYECDPDECCRLLKVEPTKEAVKDLDAWIAGLRKSEGNTRADLDYVVHKGNLVKINPILDFTELDIWRYLAINNIPVNPLYAQGYRSLGCAPCTKIVSDSEEERAGRWQGTSKCAGECGIHSKILK